MNMTVKFDLKTMNIIKNYKKSVKYEYGFTS